jgi:UDP-arabinose 4-epimerase
MARNERAAPPSRPGPACELEFGELSDGARLRSVIARHRPAAVLHFAALAYVDESNVDPAAYYRNNVGGTAELLDAMRESGVRHIVFSSSCAVYGVPKSIPISEQSPQAPINPYGAGKMLCERMVRECAAAFPLTFTALRYFNAAGADPDGEIGECHVPETHVMLLPEQANDSRFSAMTIRPTMAPACATNIHVSDLADAHVKALRVLLDGGESTAFNIGTGQGWSVRELVDKVRQVTNRDVPLHIGPRRPGDPPVLIADAARARDQLDWRPRHSDLATQVAHAWAWRQGNGRAWKRMHSASKRTA